MSNHYLMRTQCAHLRFRLCLGMVMLLVAITGCSANPAADQLDAMSLPNGCRLVEVVQNEDVMVVIPKLTEVEECRDTCAGVRGACGGGIRCENKYRYIADYQPGRTTNSGTDLQIVCD